jgi:hypothetical protein
MKTSQKKAQATHTTRRRIATFAQPSAPRVLAYEKHNTEGFEARVGRLGDAMADVLDHDGCPDLLSESITAVYRALLNSAAQRAAAAAPATARDIRLLLPALAARELLAESEVK